MRERIVLASASPRRFELLRNAGFDVAVRPTNIPELRRQCEPAVEYVRRLAREKALAAACAHDEQLIAADTVVEVGGEILEKPAGAEEAAEMLSKLSGRWHQVHTGVCLRTANIVTVEVATTRVHFLPLTANDIDRYVVSGEPLDKAGAYAIQGFASRFVDRIEGCYFNVVGLPISVVAQMLKSPELQAPGQQ